MGPESRKSLRAGQPTAQTIREIATAKVRESVSAATESDTIRLESLGVARPQPGSVRAATGTLPSVSGCSGSLMSLLCPENAYWFKIDLR